MASNVPIIRQVSWLSLIPQLAIIFLLIWLCSGMTNTYEAIMLGCLSYFIISLLLRNLIPRYHNKGMKLTKQNNFEEALPLFEKSVDFFTKYKWIDKYRFIFILSSSKMTYREMGLCNIAFCYGQLGNAGKTKEYYELVLTEYPDNVIAKTGLNFLNTIKNSPEN